MGVGEVVALAETSLVSGRPWIQSVAEASCALPANTTAQQCTMFGGGDLPAESVRENGDTGGCGASPGQHEAQVGDPG